MPESTKAPATALEVLIAARAKIEKPENWCQNQFTSDAQGRLIEYDSPEARSWCMVGVIRAVTYSDELRRKAIRNFDLLSVPAYNDAITRLHADVLWKYDEAIARARGARNIDFLERDQ